MLQAYRNKQLDQFLPPRRQKRDDQLAAAPSAPLSFSHVPIVDLGIPQQQQCAAAALQAAAASSWGVGAGRL